MQKDLFHNIIELSDRQFDATGCKFIKKVYFQSLEPTNLVAR